MPGLCKTTRLFCCGIWLAIVYAVTQAQTISPLVQEFTIKARGAIVVVNSSDEPRLVSCRADGFDVDENGNPRFRPVDAALNVRIRAERVLLAPHGSRQISFDATPAAPPAWFMVTCQFLPDQPTQGLTLVTSVSSLVLIHGKHAINPGDVTICAKRSEEKVVVEVTNHGPELQVVPPGEIRGGKKEAEIRGFTLFPRQERALEVDWKEPFPPETVRLQIGRKRLEAQVN